MVNLPIFIVASDTTMGHIQASEELFSELRASGESPILVRPRLSVPRHLRRQPLLDLYEALLLSIARRMATANIRDYCVIYGSTTATFFEPASVLGRSALRYDALAAENRAGVRGLVQRLLEKRAIRAIAVNCPMSSTVTRVRQSLLQKPTVPLPPIIEAIKVSPGLAAGNAVAYCGNPKKKGLQLILEGWAIASPKTPSSILRVAGITRTEAQLSLSDGFEIPSRVDFLGPLSHGEFIELLAESFLYISGSEVEDFGAAQLEALAAGLTFVCLPGQGAYEGLRALEQVRPDLIAASRSGEALATVITRAFGLSSDELATLRVELMTWSDKFSGREFSKACTRLLTALDHVNHQ